MTSTLMDATFESKLDAKSTNTEYINFNVRDMTFSSGKRPHVTIDGEDYFLTDGSFRQIAEQLSIPVPYARRIPDDLLSYTVNYFINNNNRSSLSALVEDGSLRSFMKPNYPYISYSEMFSAVRSAVGDNYDLRYAKLSDTKTSFSILPNDYIDSVDGSNLFGGVKVIFSDAWDVHPSIDSYIWRELCSNGMINEIEKKKFRVAGSSHDDILRQIHDFSALAIEKIPELFENFLKLVDEPVDDYVKVLRKIVLEYKLPNKVLTRLVIFASHPDFIATISNDRIRNMHDIVNLITYVGSHDSELTPEIRQRLMEIGGNLTLTHHDRCSSCGSSY